MKGGSGNAALCAVPQGFAGSCKIFEPNSSRKLLLNDVSRESTLSEDDPVRALERLVKNICNIVPSIEPLPGDSIFQQLRFLADKEEKYMDMTQ